MSETSPAPAPARLRVVLSWLLVLIPLGWGVYQSVAKSLPLFRD